MEWKRKEKKVESTTATKYLYSFLMLFSVIILLFIQWFLFSCGEWSEISHTKFEPWHAENFWFFFSFWIEHCALLIQWRLASDSFYFFFTFVLFSLSLTLPNLWWCCDERMKTAIRWRRRKREQQQPASKNLTGLIRFCFPVMRSKKRRQTKFDKSDMNKNDHTAFTER